MEQGHERSACEHVRLKQTVAVVPGAEDDK